MIIKSRFANLNMDPGGGNATAIPPIGLVKRSVVTPITVDLSTTQRRDKLAFFYSEDIGRLKAIIKPPGASPPVTEITTY